LQAQGPEFKLQYYQKHASQNQAWWYTPIMKEERQKDIAWAI
jgi:hypothetical protein